MLLLANAPYRGPSLVPYRFRIVLWRTSLNAPPLSGLPVGAGSAVPALRCRHSGRPVRCIVARRARQEPAPTAPLSARAVPVAERRVCHSRSFQSGVAAHGERAGGVRVYLHGPEIARLLAAGVRVWPNWGEEVPYESAYEPVTGPDVFTSKLNVADFPGGTAAVAPLVDQ